MPRTIIEKLWDSHVVHEQAGAPTLLYIDLHLVHEVTSPQAFDGLRARGLKVRRPDLTIATADHSIPTSDRSLPIVDKVAANLKKWEKKLDEWKEVRLAIQLQIYINEGNEYLRAMLKAKQNEKFDEVFEQFANVKALVEKMRHEEREEFHRNADAIFIRAKGLNDEALKLKKIKEFNLIVTGIVVDPRPESKNRAIIVFDDASTNDKRLGRIYEENDDIRDKEDRKVPGLKVIKISEGSIKFKYEDTEFIRELKSPQ